MQVQITPASKVKTEAKVLLTVEEVNSCFDTALSKCAKSARIDGAGRLRTIWSIILPMIKRSMMFVVVSDTISNLLMFIPVHMITLGGPEGSTDLIMYEAYKTGFVYADFGKSYAMVSLLIIFAFAVVMVEMKLLKPKY